MPGSTVTTLPAASVSLDSRESRGASCTSSPTPWPRPWPNSSPKPAAVDHVARGRVDLRAGRRPRATAVEPGELRLEADVVGVAQLVRQRPGRERARAVGAVAVELGARVDDDASRRPRPSGRSGRACGCAPFGPAATIVSNAGASAPSSWKSSSSRQASSRSVRPTKRLLGEALERLARDRGRAADRVELRLVLDRAQRLDEAAPRDELEPAGARASRSCA